MPERGAARIPVVGSTVTAPHRAGLVRTALAGSVAGIALVAAVVSVLAWTGSPFDTISVLSAPLTFGLVGAFLTVRVTTNPIGPMLLLATVGFTLLIAGGTWVIINGDLPGPGVALAATVANLAFIPSLVLILVGVPLVFPDGRLLSPRWAAVAIALGLAVLLAELRILLGTPILMDNAGLPNPLYLPALEPVLAAGDELASLVAGPLFGLSMVSLFLRYRRSDQIGRLQIRWLVAAAAAAAALFGVSFFASAAVADAAESLGVIALNLIPVAIGIAIVRHRLFEIDRIISRSISYALITIILIATYAAAVVLLQGPLGGIFGNDTVVVALSTLVVAGLFQPLRRRVQRSVDQRFDRARVDGDRTAGAFGTRLRDEVDIDAVLTDLSVTVDGALRPTRLQVWLRDPGR